MHITRWLALVPAIVLSAACGAGGPSKAGGWAQGRDPLAQDVALAALEHSDPVERPVWLAGAVVCPPASASARPAAAQQARAARLLELGKRAALMGNTDGARDLLRQAAYLDGTSPAAAYHLARASEIAGDTTTAVREYCRYLAVGASGAERAEVRERLLLLAPAPAVPAGAALVAGRPTRRPARAAMRRSVAPAGGARASAAVSGAADPRPSRSAPAASPHVAERDGATYDERSDGAVATATKATDRADGADGAGGVTGAAAPPPPATPGEPARRTARDAAIGAVIGAAAGAVVSRDVRGAVVGAAAGGVLGAILGRPARGTRRP